MTISIDTQGAFAHVVSLRSPDGMVQSYQLRIGDGGKGKSRAFAVRKHGGPRKAMREVRAFAAEIGVTIRSGRHGSTMGRRSKKSRTPAAGIRFVWKEGRQSVLYVCASWSEGGKARHNSWSTAVNGLEGALDRAIEKRVRAGAPDPDRKSLLRALRAEYAKR